jgi:hypothetical protein
MFQENIFGNITGRNTKGKEKARQGSRFKVQAKGKGKARHKERGPRVSKGIRAHQGKWCLASRG